MGLTRMWMWRLAKTYFFVIISCFLWLCDIVLLASFCSALIQYQPFWHCDLFFHWQVIMATNRADTLDPALLRPGRLDRKIEFPLPDRRQKRLVFTTITSKMNLSEEVDLEDCILLTLNCFSHYEHDYIKYSRRRNEGNSIHTSRRKYFRKYTSLESVKKNYWKFKCFI